MFDFNSMSNACLSGAQAQTATTMQIMWDDIQQLKKDVKTLVDAFNHIDSDISKCKHESDGKYYATTPLGRATFQTPEGLKNSLIEDRFIESRCHKCGEFYK